MTGGLRIVRLANFVTPRSGGLRTALRHLGAGYRAAGHEPVLVIPGQRAADETYPRGRVITLPGPRLPGIGGYRLLTGRRRLARSWTTWHPTGWRSPTGRPCAGRAGGRGRAGCRR